MNSYLEIIPKDVLDLIIGLISNRDVMSLKSTNKAMLIRLLPYKPDKLYSTIVLWTISQSDPNKEFDIRIKQVEAKDLPKTITLGGQKLIDLHNREVFNKEFEYSPFCYECCKAVEGEWNYSEEGDKSCPKHQGRKHRYLTNDSFDIIKNSEHFHYSKKVWRDSFEITPLDIQKWYEEREEKKSRNYNNLLNYMEHIISPLVTEYDEWETITVIDEFHSSYYFVQKFLIFKDHKKSDEIYLLVAEH